MKLKFSSALECFFNTNEHALRLLLQLGALWRLPQSGAEYSRASSVLWFIFYLIHDKHCGVNLFNSNNSNKAANLNWIELCLCCLPSSNLGLISRPCSDRRVSLNPTPHALTPLVMVVGHPWVAEIMLYYNNNNHILCVLLICCINNSSLFSWTDHARLLALGRALPAGVLLQRSLPEASLQGLHHTQLDALSIVCCPARFPGRFTIINGIFRIILIHDSLSDFAGWVLQSTR